MGRWGECKIQHNELMDFFIMMDCTVVQDNNTSCAREGAKLWGLEYCMRQLLDRKDGEYILDILSKTAWTSLCWQNPQRYQEQWYHPKWELALLNSATHGWMMHDRHKHSQQLPICVYISSTRPNNLQGYCHIQLPMLHKGVCSFPGQLWTPICNWVQGFGLHEIW